MKELVCLVVLLWAGFDGAAGRDDDLVEDFTVAAGEVLVTCR